MLTRRAIAASCALVALAGACSSSKHTGAPSDTATTTRPTTASTPTTAPGTTQPSTAGTTGPATGLASLILATAPSGYVQQPDAIGDTGPTNLAKAVLDDVSPNGRQALLASGFVDGYQRQWTSVDASGNTVGQDFIFLYEFSSPTGALAYADHWRQTLLATNQGVALQSFVPQSIPFGQGLRGQDSTSGSTGVVMYAKGYYAVEALVNGGPNVDQSGPAGELASAQFERLP